MGMRDPALAVRRMDMAGRALALVGHWADEICGLRGRLSLRSEPNKALSRSGLKAVTV